MVRVAIVVMKVAAWAILALCLLIVGLEVGFSGFGLPGARSVGVFSAPLPSGGLILGVSAILFWLLTGAVLWSVLIAFSAIAERVTRQPND
jgi:hypothetical protein